MPLRSLKSPAATGGGLRPLDTTGAPIPASQAEKEASLPSAGALLGGGAALAGVALLARSGRLPQAIKTGLEYANALRQQAMLSGFAPLKSFAGNLGAGIAASAERRSTAPLRELLSMQTVNDAKAAYRAGANFAPTAASVSLPGPTPGRIMGAVDEATQAALRRAGLTADEAERAVFQSRLGKNYGPLGARFENNPVADYIFPFRRTPLNQFAEGLETLKAKDPLVLGAYTAAGAAHGAATSDEQYPVSLPFGVALSAKYGLPYGLAAIAGRTLAGGKGSGNVAGSVLPVSEYGLTQSIEEPLAPFTEPAALGALKKLTGR